MQILTYSLRDGEDSSDGFYRRAAELADAFLLYGRERLLPEARRLRQLAELTGAEAPRSAEEYAFDLLTAGVLWRVYRTNAQEPPTAAQWQKLLLWLEATGEFNQEAARMRLAAACLGKAPPGAFRAAAEAAAEAAAWLEDAGARMLGGYTRQVEHFRAGLAGRSSRREDAVLRNRSQVEYHLNLLGAELMNRAYRGAFTAAAKRAVLLPVCLRARSGQACAAVRSNQGHTCLQCDKSCRVASVLELGAAEGFEVILIPHESDAFSHTLISRLLQENTSIVGVACALNLVSGGLRAKAAGLAAQCVILDYCGCEGHWDDAGGFPTDLNLSRLQAVLRSN